jgi:hypothetical protein
MMYSNRQSKGACIKLQTLYLLIVEIVKYISWVSVYISNVFAFIVISYVKLYYDQLHTINKMI